MFSVIGATLFVFALSYALYIRLSWSWLRSRALASELKADSYVQQAKHGKEMWVVANPIGGDGRGPNIYRYCLKPLLDKAAVPHVYIETKYAGHPFDIASNIDPTRCFCLVLISGDGMVHEVTNGYANKCDNDVNKIRTLFSQVPLAFVPSGSSNGLSASFGYFDPVAACVGVVNGFIQALDVSEVDFVDAHSKQVQKKVWDAHALCLGMVADHDKIVEQSLRGLGTLLKGLIAPVYCIAMRKEYDMQLDFLDGFSATDEETRKKGKYVDTATLPNTPGAAPGWKRVAQKTISLVAFTTQWAASDALVAPFSTRDNGCVDIMVVPGGPDMTRFQLAKIFLSFADGSHVEHPQVKMFRAKAYKVAPDVDADRTRTTLAMSGEQYDLHHAHVVVHRGVLRVVGYPEVTRDNTSGV